MQWQVRDRATAQRPRRFTGILMVGALIAGSAAAGSLATSHAPASVVFAAPSASSSVIHPEGGYADVVAKVAPAVVTVRSQRVVKVADESPLGGQDPFEEFFGRQFPGRRSQPQPPRREGALGSGYVLAHQAQRSFEYVNCFGLGIFLQERRQLRVCDGNIP